MPARRPPPKPPKPVPRPRPAPERGPAPHNVLIGQAKSPVAVRVAQVYGLKTRQSQRELEAALVAALELERVRGLRSGLSSKQEDALEEFILRLTVALLRMAGADPQEEVVTRIITDALQRSRRGAR